MPKKIRHDFAIYIAPSIQGYYEDGYPKAFDDTNSLELNPDDINAKIYIYERQVNEWFLNRASSLISEKKNGFIILMICLAYFEGVEQYRTGNSSRWHSSEFFINSVKRVYGETFENTELEDLYSEARCGLFHNGMVSGKILIDYSLESSIEIPNNSTIKINPKKLLKDIKKDFKKYIKDLKNNSNIDLRVNFDQMFSNVR